MAEENHKEAAEFCCLEIQVAALDWLGRNARGGQDFACDDAPKCTYNIYIFAR